MFRTVKREILKKKKVLLLILALLIPSINSQVTFQAGNVKADSPSQPYGLDELKKFNITLYVENWEGEVLHEDFKVIIYDLEEEYASTYLIDNGSLNLKLIPSGSYAILIQRGERTVSYERIKVVNNGNFALKTWNYDLNLTLLDEEGNPLSNHTVLLHEQTSQKPLFIGVGDGNKTTFHLGHPHIVKDTERIYINGILTKNYKIDYTTGNLTFLDPPSNGTIISAEYIYRIPYMYKINRAVETVVMTEKAGPLIARAETDENGKVSFENLWNGTYRLTIMGKEKLLEEYVLGRKVLIRQEPAEGDFILEVQKPVDAALKLTRSDLRLRLVTKSHVPVVNATVEVRNRDRHLLYEGLTNSTGHVEWDNLYVTDEPYLAYAYAGNRLIGFKMINTMKNETLTLKCWTNNLTITCVDQEGNPLPNHLVFLYDQLIFSSPENFTIEKNYTGSLVNFTKTDENGTAYFRDLWNGTYYVKVLAGNLISEYTVNLQETTSITLKCNRTSAALTFLTWSREPLSEATVLIYDSSGKLFFKGCTDNDGQILLEGIYLGNYTIYLEWMGVQVWSGTLEPQRNRELTVQCQVYHLTIQFTDPFGKKLVGAEVLVERKRSPTIREKILKLETDSEGRVSILLPYGSYRFYCSHGIYFGSLELVLNDDAEKKLTCNVRFDVWISMVIIAVPSVTFTIILEWRRLKAPLEIRRYRNMLSRLEAMYKAGQVEYKIYRKIREELETKIIELGGREVR